MESPQPRPAAARQTAQRLRRARDFASRRRDLLRRGVDLRQRLREVVQRAVHRRLDVAVRPLIVALHAHREVATGDRVEAVHAGDSLVEVWVVPTDEGTVAAREALALIAP